MAARYWVGGTANWDGTAGTKWALTSGGAGGQTVPTINDDVYIDSGSGVNTVTVTATANCKSLNFVSGSGSFAGTFAGSSATNCANILTVSASMTWSYTGTITFNGTTAGGTITTNGKAIDSALTFNGVGGSWALQDALTTGATRTVTLTNGTLNLNNKNLTCGIFSNNNSNTRTLAYGTGQIYLLGSATTIYTATTATGLTITGTPIVNCTYSGSTGTRQINGGGTATLTTLKTAFNISAGSDTVTIGGGSSYGNVNFTGFAGLFGFSASDPSFYGNLTFGGGMTGPSSATRALQFVGTSGTQTITTNAVTINSGVTFNGIGGTFAFADAMTVGSTNTVTCTAGTIKFKAGTTNTAGTFAIAGTVSNQVVLNSTTNGSTYTLSQASGIVNASYMTIKDSTATGGAGWDAFTSNGNIDAGNNTGWVFDPVPSNVNIEYPTTLRSFTQPRRF
jgi:hypothetical protein